MNSYLFLSSKWTLNCRTKFKISLSRLSLDLYLNSQLIELKLGVLDILLEFFHKFLEILWNYLYSKNIVLSFIIQTSETHNNKNYNSRPTLFPFKKCTFNWSLKFLWISWNRHVGYSTQVIPEIDIDRILRESS